MEAFHAERLVPGTCLVLDPAHGEHLFVAQPVSHECPTLRGLPFCAFHWHALCTYLSSAASLKIEVQEAPALPTQRIQLLALACILRQSCYPLRGVVKV